MKRLLSVFLILCLLLPVFAFAEEEDLDIEEIYEDVDLDNTEADLDTGDEEGGSSGAKDETLTADLQKELADSLESKEYVPTNLDTGNLFINPNLPDNVINILLLGVDTREAELVDKDIKRADVQLILSYNMDNGSIKLSSILRDTLVTNPFTGKNSAINESYSSYDDKNIFHDNPERSVATINYNFEMNIQYYVTINFHGVAAIVDALGGVDVDLTKGEAWNINYYLKKNARRRLEAYRAHAPPAGPAPAESAENGRSGYVRSRGYRDRVCQFKHEFRYHDRPDPEGHPLRDYRQDGFFRFPD